MARTGAQALIGALKENGAEYLFGIPGTHTLSVYDALIGDPALTPIVPRHEQGAGFAADAYARVTGRPGVTFTVPGPGGTNLATALQSAFEDSVPMVAVTAALPDADRNRGAIHDMDMEKALAAVVKKCLIPDSVAAVGPAVDAAFRWAAAGRPGPVQVVMKSDLFQKEEERALRRPAFAPPPPGPAAPPEDLGRAADALRKARRPVLYAGGGAVAAGCAHEIQLLSAKLGAPVVTSIKARGILSEADPLCFGTATFAGCEEMLAEADLCLAVGTGFGQFATLSGRVPVPENLIQIDIDPGRIGRNYPAALGIAADAGAALRGLLDRLEEMDGVPPGGEGHFRVCAGRELYRERLARFLEKPQEPPFHGLFVAKTLREAAPPETVFVTDSSATESWLMEQVFEIYRPRSLLLSEAYQTMGYAVSAALGARLGAPDRPVCAAVGDGNFTMVCAELATAVDLGLSVVYLIFNDGTYGALRHFQRYVFGGRYSCTDLRNPDFPALAAAFGAKGRRVRSAEDLRIALDAAFREGGVQVIDCPIDRDVLPTRWERTLRHYREKGRV